MSYTLHTLAPASGSKKRSRRLGRGHGSGRGKTAGRGTKGQKARTGGRGGLKRLGMRRMLLAQPKSRGFRSIHPRPAIVNLDDIERVFPANAPITTDALVRAGLIPRVTNGGVKILGRGAITKVITVRGITVSDPAREKIVAAGGTIEH